MNNREQSDSTDRSRRLIVNTQKRFTTKLNYLFVECSLKCLVSDALNLEVFSKANTKGSCVLKKRDDWTSDYHRLLKNIRRREADLVIIQAGIEYINRWAHSPLSFVEHFINIYRMTILSSNELEKHFSFVCKNCAMHLFKKPVAVHLLKKEHNKAFIWPAQELIEFRFHAIAVTWQKRLDFGMWVWPSKATFSVVTECVFDLSAVSLCFNTIRTKEAEAFREWDCRRRHLSCWSGFSFPHFLSPKIHVLRK